MSKEQSTSKTTQTPNGSLSENSDWDDDRTNYKQRRIEDDQADGDDSEHEDDSGDEDDNGDDSKDHSHSEDPNSAINSLLPQTPTSWMNLFEQSGELPTNPLSSYPPMVSGLGNDNGANNNNTSHEDSFMFGAIPEDMSISPLCVPYGRPILFPPNGIC